MGNQVLLKSATVLQASLSMTALVIGSVDWNGRKDMFCQKLVMWTISWHRLRRVDRRYVVKAELELLICISPQYFFKCPALDIIVRLLLMFGQKILRRHSALLDSLHIYSIYQQIGSEPLKLMESIIQDCHSCNHGC